MRKIDILGTIAYNATVSSVYEGFALSFAKMVQYNTSHIETKDKKIYYDRQQMSWLPRARNDMVKAMRGEWLFMLDADLEFDPDAFYRLLTIANKYEAPVVSGLYVHKKKPHYPVLYSRNTKRKVYEIVGKWSPTDLFQVDAAGGGFLFIRKFVFQLIWEQLHEEPFKVIGNLGEDFSFFDRLRRIGVGVYCAPTIQVSHLNITPEKYNVDNFNKNFLSKPYQK